MNEEKGLPTGLGKYVPPKMWEDLTDSEKIERMREEVKRTLAGFSGRITELNREVQKLKVHSHSGGEVVVPITRTDGYLGESSCCSKRADGKSYF